MLDFVKEQLIKAMDSGEFNRGSGSLYEKANHWWNTAVGIHPTDMAKETHCTLGLVCELAYQHGVVDKNDTPTAYRYGKPPMEGLLPKAVAEWAGIDTDEQNVIAVANDNGVYRLRQEYQTPSWDDMKNVIRSL